MIKKGLVLAFIAVSMMIGGNAIAQDNKKECPKSKTECPECPGCPQQKGDCEKEKCENPSPCCEQRTDCPRTK